MSLKYSFIVKWNIAARQMIRRWLTLWMVDDWVKTRILSWLLNAWTISLNFSNALSISECFISFTNRDLKIRTSADTSSLLTDSNTLFSSRSTISFCLNEINDKSTNDESTLMILKMTSAIAIDARYFLDRSRSRFADPVNDSVDLSVVSTIESVMRFELICSDDENSRLHDMINWLTSNDDKCWSW